jgi:hypothetical protein
MSVVRKTGMLVIGVIALFAFLAQSSACFAERAGILPGCEQSSHHDHGTAPLDPLDADCCHVETISPCAQHPSADPALVTVEAYCLRDMAAPEGPVEEIDYPPQLLS